MTGLGPPDVRTKVIPMPADSPPFTPPDPGRVNPMDPVEVDHWCREFGCSEATLRAGIAAVGEHVAALRPWLSGRAGEGG
jgi:hypothetical protein